MQIRLCSVVQFVVRSQTNGLMVDSLTAGMGSFTLHYPPVCMLSASGLTCAFSQELREALMPQQSLACC